MLGYGVGYGRSIPGGEGDLGVLQGLVDLVGIELEALQVDDFLLVGLEGEVDLTGKGTVPMVA